MYYLDEDEKYPVYTIREKPPWFVRKLLKITADELADYTAARDKWDEWQQKLAKWCDDPERFETRKYEQNQ